MLTTLTSNASKFASVSGATFQKLALVSAVAVAGLTPNFALAQSNYEIQMLQQQRELYQEQVENLHTDLGTYVISNPKASAALLASRTGVAATFADDLDPAAKFALALAGAFGVNHCLTPGNRQHCAQVALQIGSYVTQINNYEEKIDSLTWQLNRLR